MRNNQACTAFKYLLAMLAFWLPAVGKAQVRSNSPNFEAMGIQTETLPTPPVHAAVPQALTLEQLEEMALSANPSVRRMAALVGAARGNWVQVGLQPNPSVGYEGQQLGSGGFAEQHGVLFSQELIRRGKLQMNRVVAERERMHLMQELEAQRLRVLTDVRIGYYHVLLAQRQIDIATNLIQISQEGMKSADTLFRANEVGRADVLQAEIEAESAQILAQNARNRHDAAWRSLAAVLGQPAMPPQPLMGDALAPHRQLTFQDTLDRLRQTSPEVSSAGLEVQRARAAVTRARMEPMPNVNVQGLVNWQDNGIGGKPDGGVAVTVPIPLFNRNQGGIAQAEHQLVAARQAFSQVALDLQNRLATVYERYANAQNQVQRYQQAILPRAQESLDLNRQTYNLGEQNYTALLMAQRTYARTQMNYLDAVRDLRVAEAEIDGLLLSGSLQSSASGRESTPAPVRESIPVGGLELFGQ